MKKFYLLMIAVSLLVSCETKNNCDDFLCTSPIPFLTLNIVSAESGENLFSRNVYTIDDVTLFNENNESLPIWLDNENHLELVIGEIVGNNEYRLLISPELEIIMLVQVAPADDTCCSSPTLEIFNVLNFDFESTKPRSYTIFIK